jgi:uncharacterized Rmd1/YagE family protein
LSIPPNAEGMIDGGEELSSEGPYDEFTEGRARRSRKSKQRGNEDGAWERTIGEQLTPEQREENGYQRLTAYYCCEEFKMSLLSGFLKREHAVSPRSAHCLPDSPKSNISSDYMMTLSMLFIICLFYLGTNQTSTFVPA